MGHGADALAMRDVEHHVNLSVMRERIRRRQTRRCGIGGGKLQKHIRAERKILHLQRRTGGQDKLRIVRNRHGAGKRRRTLKLERLRNDGVRARRGVVVIQVEIAAVSGEIGIEAVYGAIGISA